MDFIIGLIGQLLGYVIKPCYLLTKNYGLAILLFTLISKFVLLPISIWVQKNGIKLVQMQPEINWLKVNYFGDADTISEKQLDIYKKYKYNAMASVIPLLVQVVILLGLVEVIYNPLRYIFGLPEELSAAMVALTGQLTGADVMASSVQMTVVSAVKNAAHFDAFMALAAQFPQVDMAAVIAEIQGFGMELFGLDISLIPAEAFGVTLAVPVLAALSAWIMCVTQNHSQVLQAEQGKLNQISTMAISVGLSLYLGFFVPAGIGIYWMASNLLSIAQMYLLNMAIDPKKYVDYAELDKSREAMAALEEMAGGKKTIKDLFKNDPNAKREKQDYKKFFSVLGKHVVFYSEKSGFWKYYKDIVEQLLRRTNIKVHYITNDPDDQIFEIAKKEPRIIPYYIGPRRIITLMMKMEADVVVMTTPDLETYQIKRSKMSKDVEYIYTPHDAMSVHMGFREHALDHFDTVLCAGPQQMDEIRASEKLYGTKEKTLVPCGYCMLDNLVEGFEKQKQQEKARKRILIAPSWQEDNLLDSVIDDLLSSLLCDEYQVVVRPHPEYVKRYRPRMDALMARWESKVGEGLVFETDFSSNSSIWTSDALVTDWSGIAYEYSYTTLRPTLFVNTKIKAPNPNWEKVGITPLEISLRDQIGMSLEKGEVATRSKAVIADMIDNPLRWSEQIKAVREKNIFNLGHCGEKAAAYIISRLVKKK